MSKELQKSSSENSKELQRAKRIKADAEFKKWLTNFTVAEEDPEAIFKPLWRIYVDLAKTNNPEKQKELMSELRTEVSKDPTRLARALSLDSKIHLASAVDKGDGGFVLEMARSLEKEFSAQKPSEKAIIQAATLAYWKMHRFTNMSTHFFQDILSMQANPELFKIINKEADRAHRQFLAAIQTLKQLQAPEMQVNINTKTAFVAKNQQNISNVSKKNNDPQ